MRRLKKSKGRSELAPTYDNDNDNDINPNPNANANPNPNANPNGLLHMWSVNFT